MVHQTQWHPNTWKASPIVQDVVYEDQEGYSNVLTKLAHLPPMVSPREIEDLKEHLKNAALGKTFLLQGGDCAELFSYCSQEPIENKLKVLARMADLLSWGAQTPVVRIARIAGQYGKPRSNPMELHKGEKIYAFRGDNVNGSDPDDRKPDPQRLLQAYFHSAATLNYMRTLTEPDMRKNKASYTETPTISTVYTSHEALFLDYEASLTRYLTSPSTGVKKWYNSGAHFLWIGDRTRQPNGAHVEYMRGVENPIGIKVGPTTVPEQLVDLLNTLNPKKEIGKITLITRFGADKVESHLPDHIAAVKKSGHIPVWICDPMHGNTRVAKSNQLKTRDFSNIVKEITATFEIHQMCNSKLNGVHLELTGESVTECVGGTMEVKESDLPLNYQTFCDPRLNKQQSLDVALITAGLYDHERSLRK